MFVSYDLSLIHSITTKYCNEYEARNKPCRTLLTFARFYKSIDLVNDISIRK